MSDRVDHVLLRALYALLGVVVLSAGSAVLRTAGTGLDPYTAANVGISERLGLGLGLYQLISNAVLLIPMLLVGRRYLGVGTLINMVLAGFFIEWFSELLAGWMPGDPTDGQQAGFFAIGIVLFAFGAALYMSAGVGTAPYDAIAPMVVDATGWPYRPLRVVQDTFFLMVALLVSGPVGVGTIVTAFFAGPLIDLFSRKVTTPLIRTRVAAAGDRGDLLSGWVAPIVSDLPRVDHRGHRHEDSTRD